MSEKLTMTVDVRAQLNQFNSAMNTAKEVLNKTFSGKGVKTYTDELNKVGRIFDKIARTTAGPIDSKATFGQMQKEVMDATQRLENLRDAISNIRNLTFEQRLSFLPDDFDKNFKKATIAAEKYSSVIKSIPKNINSFSIEGVGDGLSFKKLGDEIGNAKRVLVKVEELENKIADKEAERASINEKLSGKRQLQEIIAQEKALEERNKAEEKYQRLFEKSQKSKRKVPITEDDIIDTAAKLKEGQGAEGAINRVIQGRNLSSETQAALTQFLKDSVGGKLPTTKPTSNIDKGFVNKGKDILELAEAYNEAQQAQANFIAAGGEESKVEELKARSLEEDEKQLTTLTATTEGLETKLNEVNKEINAYNNELDSKREKEQEARETIEKYTKAQEELQKVFDAKNAEDRNAALQEMTQTLKTLSIDTSQLGDLSGKSDKEIKTLVQSLYDEQVVTKQVEEILPEMINRTEELANCAEETSLAINKESEAFDKLSERSENIDRLTARVKQFTGFVGVINIARKAMRDALSTVKELDRAMTSMAVVTKSTVSDYWSQLPEYTARANKLGASIRDMYEADTLYYQQGLKTNQVMQVANETMKMARIAGLGAAEATDRMTNALRGFNMAINEESAQRINDVYSKLAAITASDVDEISTAMTKTASIANSAGMEFETTAAFLSQIIETTRESAETAGTALKTVIARFQELKKAPSEIGEVDGEIVDANKIEGALRTVGVALRDSEGQFRKLDDVFMELAGKWSDLDKNTQRYIATIAAGSRQQSRFIALMQDYSHTIELVDAAYTSTGTSQQQYEKTLESMETILKRLSNSWDTFTMGLFNSNALKIAAKFGTEFLNIINAILEKLDDLHLGLARILIVGASINKLGVGFKVFTNELKQTTGTIGSSFAAVGVSIKEHFTGATEKANAFNIALKKQAEASEGAKTATNDLAIAKATEEKATKAATDAELEYQAVLEKRNGLSKKARKSTKEKLNKDAQEAGIRFGNRKNESEVAIEQVAEAERKQKEANEVLIKSNLELAQSMGLNNEQSKTFINLMEASNVQSKDAEQIKRLSIIASNEEATAKYRSALASGQEATAELQEQIIEEMGLKQKNRVIAKAIMEYVARSKLLKVITLGMSKKIADIAISKLDAKANITLAESVWTVTTAFLSMAAVIAGIAAAIYLIVRVTKDLYATKLSERIKQTQERLNECNEALKDCKDSLKDLEETQEKYKSLHEELEKNIRGTDEWKKKLVEVNEQVYDLIQKYPVLASYIKRQESGELTISDEGWSAITQQAQEKLSNAKIAQYTAQRKLLELQQQKEQKELIKTIAKNEGISRVRASSYLDNIELQAELSPDSLSALGKNNIAIERNTSALNILSEGLIQKDDQDEQNVVNGLLKSVLQRQEKADQGQTGLLWQVARSAALPFFGTENEVNNIAGMAVNNSLYKSSKDFLNWAELFGLNKSDFGGDNSKDLAKLYATMKGVEVTDEMITRAKNYNDPVGMLNEISEAVQIKRAEAKVERLNENLTPEQREALAHAYTVTSIKSSDLDKINKIIEKGTDIEINTFKDSAEEIQKKLDSRDIALSLKDVLNDLGFKSFDDYYAAQIEAIQKGMQKPVKEAIEAISSYDFSLDQIEAMGHLFDREYAHSRETQIEDFIELLKEENGQEVIEAFLNFDTKSIEGLEEARNALIEKWPSLTKEINELINRSITLSGAIHKIDFSKIQESLTKALTTLQNLTSQTSGDTFSEEIYKSYVDAGIAKEEDFIETAEGKYVYIKPLQELKEAIEQNTAALLEEEKNGIENKFDLVEKYRNLSIKDKVFHLGDFLAENSDLMGSLKVAGISNYEDYRNAGVDLRKEWYDTFIDAVKNYTEDEFKKDLKDVENLYVKSEIEKGFGPELMANYEQTSDTSKLLALRGKLGSEEGDRAVQILANLGKATDKSNEKYLKFLRTLTNNKALKGAEESLKKHINKVKEFSEEYDDLGDENLKFMKTFETGTSLGLQNITKENYDVYANLFKLFSEGNEQAYEEIVRMIISQSGFTADEINILLNQTSDNWTDKMAEMASTLQALGFAYEESVGGGKIKLNLFNSLGFATQKGAGNNSKDEWEDPYNWLWNINKRINKEIFERERLERAYQKAVEDTTKSEEDLYNLSKKELENLERQAVLERDKGQKAIQEAQMMMKQRPDFGNYVSWNTETGQIQVDYNKIDKENWGSARGEAFEAFVSRLEELNDEVQDSQTTLEEIEDLTEDIKNRGRDQYIELQDRIKEALVEINQREIDTAQKINDSIKTAQDALLNKIQEEISETRQIRSNQEKEQELEDKRQRLSYLRRDTTGANAVQIRQLEEELRKGEQSYTDSLTDQTISNIQKANQKAEEQRTEQIEIMNNQLTRWQETGAIWDAVNTSINEGFNNPDSFLNSNIASLIASAENRRALSEIQQADWDKELENQAKLAELFNNGQLYQQGEETLISVKACASGLYKMQQDTGVLGKVNQSFYDLLTNVYPADYSDKIKDIAGGVASAGMTLDEIMAKMKELTGEGEQKKSFSELLMSPFNSITKSFSGIINQMKEVINGIIRALIPNNLKVSLFRFASGGLSSSTGPAWLDGTPTKPEYVLNADQTKAFFDLVNTLTGSDSAKGGVSGDNYFDIDINVDKIDSDYDVDKMAARIKEQIWEDSQYRNVNLVSLLR